MRARASLGIGEVTPRNVGAPYREPAIPVRIPSLRCRMADGLGVEVDARAKQDAALAAAFAYRDAVDGGGGSRPR
jgi:hypothetical protein